MPAAESHQRPHQSGLADAVRAEDRHELTARDRQIDALHHRAAGIVPGSPSPYLERVHRTLPTAAWSA